MIINVDNKEICPVCHEAKTGGHSCAGSYRQSGSAVVERFEPLCCTAAMGTINGAQFRYERCAPGEQASVKIDGRETLVLPAVLGSDYPRWREEALNFAANADHDGAAYAVFAYAETVLRASEEARVAAFPRKLPVQWAISGFTVEDGRERGAFLRTAPLPEGTETTDFLLGGPLTFGERIQSYDGELRQNGRVIGRRSSGVERDIEISTWSLEGVTVDAYSVEVIHGDQACADVVLRGDMRISFPAGSWHEEEEIEGNYSCPRSYSEVHQTVDRFDVLRCLSCGDEEAGEERRFMAFSPCFELRFLAERGEID